jgi:hypothetical protein
VETEDLVFDQGSEWEIVKEIGEVFPHVCIAIFAKTLVVKAVDLGDLSGFMVATKNSYALRIADLQGYEQSYGFDGEITTVNIIA